MELALRAYTADVETGARSNGAVTSSLATVLAQPYLASRLRISDRAFDVSATGRYLVSENAVVGPLTLSGLQSPISTETNLATSAFFHHSDTILYVESSGQIWLTDLDRPEQRRNFGTVASGDSTIKISGDDSTAVVSHADGTSYDVVSLVSGQVRSFSFNSTAEIIAVSNNGQLLAVVDEEGQLTIVHALAPLESPKPLEETFHIRGATFSQDDQHLYLGGAGGEVADWDLSTGDLQSMPSAFGSSINYLAISPDGTLLAGGSGAVAPGVGLWRLDRPRTEPSLIAGAYALDFVRFTSDGEYLVAGDTGKTVRYWRMRSPTSSSFSLNDYQPFNIGRMVFAITRMNDGRFVIGGGSSGLQIWPDSTLSGSPLLVDELRVAALRQVPDLGRFESGGRNYLETGHIMAVAGNDNGGFATVDPYGFALLWREELTERPSLIQPPDTDRAALTAAMSPSGKWFAIGGASGMTRLYELKLMDVVAETDLQGNSDGSVWAMQFVGEERLFLGTTDGRLVEWQLGSKPVKRVLLQNEGEPILAMVATSDARTLYLSVGSKIARLDLAAPQAKLVTIFETTATPVSLAISPDSSRLAAGLSDGSIRAWSIAAPDHVLEFPAHLGYVRALEFDETGKILISGGDDGNVRRTVIDLSLLASIACEVLWNRSDSAALQQYVPANFNSEFSCSSQAGHN